MNFATTWLHRTYSVTRVVNMTTIQRRFLVFLRTSCCLEQLLVQRKHSCHFLFASPFSSIKVTLILIIMRRVTDFTRKNSQFHMFFTHILFKVTALRRNRYGVRRHYNRYFCRCFWQKIMLSDFIQADSVFWIWFKHIFYQTLTLGC